MKKEEAFSPARISGRSFTFSQPFVCACPFLSSLFRGEQLCYAADLQNDEQACLGLAYWSPVDEGAKMIQKDHTMIYCNELMILLTQRNKPSTTLSTFKARDIKQDHIK
jgi:hypothetical protein